MIMMNKNYDIKKSVINIIGIAVASVMYAAGISLFLDPNNLVPGGMTGLAMILNRLTGLETGTLVFMMNIPLLIISIWKFGLKFLLSTIYAIIISSLFMNIFVISGALTDDLLLASLAGGGLVALGLGIIFKAGATTGGTDIVVRLIKIRHKHIKTGRIFLVVDIAVVSAYVLIFRNVDEALYSAIAVIATSTLLDVVLYGKDEAKLLYIISKSEKSETELVKKFLEELEVGVTYLKGYGAYRNTEKKVIMCAIRKQQLPKAKEIVNETDEDAFMIITSANEILGEGYKSHSGSGL